MAVEKILEGKASLIDKFIKKYIPRSFSEKTILFELYPARYTCHFEALNKAIATPIWEFLERGGKRWRPILFLLICEALGKKPEQFLEFAIIPEIIHNGTLIIDDIEDKSEFRRGRLCTYKIYGTDIAINAGNAMYFLALLPLIKHKQKMSKEKLSEICEVYIQEMINLSLGQAMDITWHRGFANVNEIRESDYLQMCAYKTGTLTRMAAKIAAILGDANKQVVDKLGYFAESIGVAFQMQDDILDLTGKEFTKKKGGARKDITEGKRTLMVIHTLEVAETQDKERLIEILNMHTTNLRLQKEAVSIMRKYGSIDYVKRFARKIVKNRWLEVKKLLPASNARDKLEVFTKFLVERTI